MTRHRPLILAALTAVASLTALALAVRHGWLGEDVDRGAEFCEAAAGRIRQPVNTLSNLGFVAAGLLIARDAGRMARLGTAYACLVVLLGPASMAMHATESSLGGRLDMLSMYLVASFAVAYAVDRVRTGAFWPVFAVCLLGCELVDTFGGELPVVMHSGNLAFGVLLITVLVIETRNETARDRRWLVAAAASLVLAFAVWNTAKDGSPLCWPGSLYQGHGVWHLLCAVSAYCLFRFYASEQLVARNERSAWASEGRANVATEGRSRGSASRPPQGRHPTQL